MSDEGMSDAPWLEHFVTSQDALGGMTFAHYRDHMDDEAMLRYRASVAENNGHDMAPVNYNSLRRIIARLDAAERERDALREALAGIRSTAINDAEHAGMRLMDGSISDLQRALARGEVKRQLALADICRSALNADGAS